MVQLNLPPFDFRLAGTAQHPQIFDVLRHRFVALTPEEWVRQHFVHFLIGHRGYPMALMANEVALSVGNKSLRADSVLYDRSLRPQMIMEYKAPSVALTARVIDQIAAYNTLLHVGYLVVSNGLAHYCFKAGADTQSLVQMAEIPMYGDL